MKKRFFPKVQWYKLNLFIFLPVEKGVKFSNDFVFAAIKFILYMYVNEIKVIIHLQCDPKFQKNFKQLTFRIKTEKQKQLDVLPKTININTLPLPPALRYNQTKPIFFWQRHSSNLCSPELTLYLPFSMVPS